MDTVGLSTIYQRIACSIGDLGGNSCAHSIDGAAEAQNRKSLTAAAEPSSESPTRRFEPHKLMLAADIGAALNWYANVARSSWQRFIAEGTATDRGGDGHRRPLLDHLFASACFLSAVKAGRVQADVKIESRQQSSAFADGVASLLGELVAVIGYLFYVPPSQIDPTTTATEAIEADSSRFVQMAFAECALLRHHHHHSREAATRRPMALVEELVFSTRSLPASKEDSASSSGVVSGRASKERFVLYPCLIAMSYRRARVQRYLADTNVLPSPKLEIGQSVLKNLVEFIQVGFCSFIFVLIEILTTPTKYCIT